MKRCLILFFVAAISSCIPPLEKKQAKEVKDEVSDIADVTDAVDIVDVSDVCAPNCGGKECGDNGCGGSCGQCDGGKECVSDKCVCGTYCDVTSKLPDTGQQKCYDVSAEISCPSPGSDFFGQDAHYTTNTMSFKDNGNGTVTDNVTGLVWMKCSAGLSGSDCSSGSVQTKIWQDAIDYCKNNTAGLPGTGWRLPSRWELQTIVNYGNWSPAIDKTYFPNTQTYWYWSSSSLADSNFYAWVVDFDVGNVSSSSKVSNHYVRCVRSGK